MSKYSRMRYPSTRRSKSIDLSDQYSFPSEIHNATISNLHYNEKKKIRAKDLLENDEDGEMFGVILSRKLPISSSSSSSSSSCNFIAEKQTTSFPSMVKKNFSLKRSVSVSEGYNRIHHQHDPSGDGYYDGSSGFSTKNTRASNKKGKILKVCRSLLGL